MNGFGTAFFGSGSSTRDVSGTPVGERRLKGDGLVLSPFVGYAASAVWSKADVKALIAAETGRDVAESSIEMLVLCVGGGSGGSVGSGSDGYGGYPGAIWWDRILMSDLPEEVDITVGAGGLSEDDGGTTSFGDLVSARGGRNITYGTEVDANTYYNLQNSWAKVPDLREQTSNFSASWPSSIDGPGGGGSVGSGRSTNGGYGSAKSMATRTDFGSDPGEAGEDAKAGQLWSFGAGGAHGGGQGGFPGGGGGAISSGTAGTGGGGVCRIEYRIKEVT